MKKILKTEGFTRTLTLQNKRKLVYGFMTIEVIIAVSIIVVSILAAMSVTQKSISVSRQALHTSQAAFLLEEGAEVVRILRDNSWNNISVLNNATHYYPVFSGSWTLSATPSTVGIFTRIVDIANVNRNAVTGSIASSGTNDTGTKLITITVSWIENGETISKNLSFYITDIFS